MMCVLGEPLLTHIATRVEWINNMPLLQYTGCSRKPDPFPDTSEHNFQYIYISVRHGNNMTHKNIL
jgi:hypothetical protein